MQTFQLPRLMSRRSRLLTILLVIGLIAILLVVPFAPPAQAGSWYYCLASLVGVGTVVVGVVTGSAGAALSIVSGIAGIVSVFGSCKSSSMWWGNFPLYQYRAGSGGGLNLVMGVDPT